MNCESVCEKLSAYLDSELASIDELQVHSHIDSCESCRLEHQQFVAVGGLIRRSVADDQAVPSWETFAQQLDRSSVRLKRHPILRFKWVAAALATAASFALLWLAISDDRKPHHDEHNIASNVHVHSAMAVDFQDVFQLAQTEPERAIGRLVARYQGKQLDRKGTTEYLGYEPALFRNVLSGFTRTSTHVLNMPCCKCSATICQRQDGTSLMIFEHKEEQPVWLGTAPSIEYECAGKPCTVIQSAGSLAVTWKNKDRQFTMIGAKDLSEVNAWVSEISL